MLRFRYTSYLGEFHPAEKKVAVQFCPTDLELTEAQQLKLKKLAGPRYNPQTEMIKMSCEMFEHQAQNKRYLGDLIAKLITEAKVRLASGTAPARRGACLADGDPSGPYGHV